MKNVFLKIDQKQLDYLCDVIWYLRGYKAATDATFEDCQFDQRHLDALEDIYLYMKKHNEVKE